MQMQKNTRQVRTSSTNADYEREMTVRRTLTNRQLNRLAEISHKTKKQIHEQLQRDL